LLRITLNRIPTMEAKMSNAFEKFLAEKKRTPILFLFGDEEFLIEEAWHKLVETEVTDKENSYDFQIIEQETMPLDRALDSCMTYPFIAERRLVIIKNFQNYFSATRKKTDSSSPFGKYLENPPQTTYLVLVGGAESLNGLSASLQKKTGKKTIDSLKFPYRDLIERYVWFEFPKVYESDLASWVMQRAKKAGREFAPDAVQLLISRVNPSLRDLASEIDKIISFCGNRKKIELDDGASAGGSSRVFNVFELQKAVGRRDLAASLNIMEKMLSCERQEMLIITILSRFFISLWRLIEESQKTTNHFQLAPLIGTSPYFVPEYLASLKRYTPDEIEKAFTILADTDEKLKSISTDSVLLLGKMLIEIVGKK